MYGTNPSIGEIAKSHKRVVDSIRDCDPEFTLARAAGLFTMPEWQSSTVRLEVLQHLVAAFATGRKKPMASDFRRWLSELGGGTVGSLEDPAEDVFVSRVLIPGRNCLVLEGSYESSAYHVQQFINILDGMPQADHYRRIRQAAYGLLKLSSEVIRRSGLKAFSVGAELPISFVSDRLLRNLGKGAERVRFSIEELQDLETSLDELAPFVFYPSGRDGLLDETIGNSSLERSPLVIFDRFAYLVLPASVSIAVRRMVIEACDGGLSEPLYAAYKNVAASAFRKMPLLGGAVDTPIAFQRVKNVYLANVAREIDSGRILHICVVIDDLTTYSQTGMLAPDPSRTKLGDAIQKSVIHAHEQFSGRANFKEGVSLVVLCSWGRPLFIEFESIKDARWRIESIAAADLETLSWESRFSPLALWRLLDARDSLKLLNVELVNVNGLLNLHGWVDSLEGHLVPHSKLPDDFDPKVGLVVMITQNAMLDIRRRLAAGWNLHYAPTWDGRAVAVRREAISSYFEEDKRASVYVSMDDLLSGRLCAVYETEARYWWTIVEAPSIENRTLLYQLWHLTVIWIRRAGAALERRFPELRKGPLLWCTRFAGTAELCPTAHVPTREEARSSLQVSVVENVIYVDAAEEFILACRSPTNIFESLLVEYLVRGVFASVGRPPSDTEIGSALSEIVPNEWARDMHALQAQGFRDYVRGKIPRKAILINQVDDAASRLNLGWQVRDRSEGARILGIEACCYYLGKVVGNLWTQIQRSLRGFNKVLLLRQLIGNHEAVLVEADSWLRSARAMLALHEDKQETALVSSRQISRTSAASLASRLLIEMALCECPQDTGDEAGELDVSRLLARALQMHQYGGWSEAIRYEGKESEIRIAPLGDVFTEATFEEKIASPYGDALGVKRFRQGADRYEQNYETPQFRPNSVNAFEPEFWLAWMEHFKFTIDDARMFLDNIENEAIRLDEYVFISSFEELAGLESAGKLSSDKVRAILDSLALVPRPSWSETPAGFKPRDWYPWRFRRRLSCVTRPILKLSGVPTEKYVVAPGMVRTGLAKVIDYCYRGGFEAKDFPVGKMRSWIGAAENRRGHEFNTQVRDRLRKLGWQAESDVRLTKLLNRKTDRDYGDVDVFAWRDRQILVIECKDLELAMTVGEMARQVFEFRGVYDRKGYPDRLKKHLLRLDLLRSNAADVRKYAKTGGTTTIDAALVFSDLVPMHFSQVATSHGVRLHTLESLTSL